MGAFSFPFFVGFGLCVVLFLYVYVVVNFGVDSVFGVFLSLLVFAGAAFDSNVFASSPYCWQECVV